MGLMSCLRICVVWACIAHLSQGSRAPGSLQVTASRFGFGFGTNTQHQLGHEVPRSHQHQLNTNQHNDSLAMQANIAIEKESQNDEDNTEEMPLVVLHPHELDIFMSAPIVNVSCGLEHVVAITEWGSIYRWGQGSRGQLGGLYSGPLEVPEMLVLLDPSESTDGSALPAWTRAATHVAAGALHTLVIVDGTEVFAWGDNTLFQLGAPIPPLVKPSGGISAGQSRDFTSTPVHVSSLTTTFGFKSAHARKHRSAVLTNSGEVWVWGDNTDGWLGPSEFPNHAPPTKVVGDFAYAADFCMGIDFFVVLDGKGDVWVWGDNHNHQLGMGADAPSTVDVPTRNPYLRFKGITHITCGYTHAIVWNNKDRKFYSFGNNEYGQLGLGHMGVQDTPDEIFLLRGLEASSVSLGRGHSLVVTTAGGTFVWGLNNQGQLGMGDTTTRASPTRLIALEGIGIRLSAACNANSFMWTGSTFNQEIVVPPPPKTGAAVPRNRKSAAPAP